MPHDTIAMIAQQIKSAFDSGKPCKVPLMTVRDLGRLLRLLDRLECAA